MNQDERTKIRDQLFEGAAAYSELEDSLVKMTDVLMEGGEPEAALEALREIIIAHREQLRGLYGVLAELGDVQGPPAQSLGEIAFGAYTAERGNRNHDGSKTPPWEKLGEPVREGWEAAARALFLVGVAAVNESRSRKADSK